MAPHDRAQHRARTGDRGPPEGEEPRVVIHTIQQIGPKRSKLPNGSLLCKDVPLARTGWMLYAPGETPIKAPVRDRAAPVCHVKRDAFDLFSPETMGSFIGAAITNGHPPVDVTPRNWRQLSMGHVLDVRRGEGEESDCLMGDLVITDQFLINAIESGKREVSAGYDADYQQIGDGEGRQFNIIANHVALVEKGRCGPRCAIGDQAPNLKKERTMKRIPLHEARQRVADAQADLEAAESGTDEDLPGGIHVHVHTGAASAGKDDEPTAGKAKTLDAATEERFVKLEATQATILESLATITKAVTKDAETPEAKAIREAAEATSAAQATAAAATAAAKTADEHQDSKALETGYKGFMSQAEILVPGFRAPTFDAAAPRARTIDTMCNARRKVLEMSFATKDGAEIIAAITGSKDLDLVSMPCPDVGTLFNAAAASKALLNNRAATADGKSVPNATDKKPATSLAALNNANTEFWAKHSA